MKPRDRGDVESGIIIRVVSSVGVCDLDIEGELRSIGHGWYHRDVIGGYGVNHRVTIEEAVDAGCVPKGAVEGCQSTFYTTR